MTNYRGEYISAEELTAMILTADKAEIETLLGAVILQYKQLFPRWDVATFSFDKGADRNTQLDNTIAALEGMKE